MVVADSPSTRRVIPSRSPSSMSSAFAPAPVIGRRKSHEGPRLFLHAEDGIRAWSVTGVQTCALPISPGNRGGAVSGAGPCAFAGAAQSSGRTTRNTPANRPTEYVFRIFTNASSGGNGYAEAHERSEERRVGKEVDHE